MFTLYARAGAMLAICDVNEYRTCVKEFKIPVVDTLFDTLHSLCNLLVVVPENLRQVSSGDQLVSALATGDVIVPSNALKKLSI